MTPQKIESFKIDHNKLKEGIYISRVDGDIVTYDLRTRKPNMGDYMDNVTMHSVEHMIATFIRSSEIGDSVIYFGPMGCRTGFYLLVRDAVSNEDVLSALKGALEKTISHDGDVFGASQIECGNYKELDIEKAKAECKRYLEVLNGYTPDFKYEE
jgi:S-ribosylhomocysteine lyase